MLLDQKAFVIHSLDHAIPIFLGELIADEEDILANAVSNSVLITAEVPADETELRVAQLHTAFTCSLVVQKESSVFSLEVFLLRMKLILVLVIVAIIDFMFFQALNVLLMNRHVLC